MPAKLNIIGEKYNLLTVIKEEEPYISPNGIKQRKYLCQCECGNTTIVGTGAIRSGHTKSCGCLQIKEIKKIGKSYVKHGHCKDKNRSKEYLAWQAIKARCYNSSNKYYSDYGGRGITVASQWINNFEQFLKDVGLAPKGRRVSIDRINNNGNYEPGNVRWVDNHSVQVINRRTAKNNTSGVTGVYWDKRTNKWKAHITINYKNINLGSFSNKEDAIKARLEAEEKYHKPLLKSV